MSSFAAPASLYMTAPVTAVLPTDPLDQVQYVLSLRGISAVAVVDEGSRLLGVVTRTDLLRVGQRPAGTRRGGSALYLPDLTAAEVMQKEVLQVSPDTPVSAAAAIMVKHHVHRVFVATNGKATGVLSTRDVMQAVWDERRLDPIGDFMSTPVLSVAFDDPLSIAVERLDQSHVSGLVVLDGDTAVGVFTQVEALEAKDAARDTPVERIMSPAMLCLGVDTPLYRAAAQAASMDVRRVIAVRDRRVRGILTGIDFARSASS